MTILVYSRIVGADFINFDDGDYVYVNPYLHSGLNFDVLGWAATSNYAANWFPLTWISHALDLQLFGVNPAAHHAMNVLFHCASALALFLFLHLATRSHWRSALVAGLFALHPLHVESVAWVSERKSVLSTFFWMLTLLAYLRYVNRPSLGRYLGVLLLFACGLMSKPMLVTLPFVLVLLDYWPLARLELSPSQLGRRVWEKAPLFLLSALSCFATYWAQSSGGTVASLASHSLGLRVSNALVAYAAYLGKMFWPTGLAIVYPHPDEIPIATASLSALLLLGLTTWAVVEARRRPYWIVGWLWFLGTLVPVIGLVQVGQQAMADRYTYIPLIGIFLALSWGAGEAAARWSIRREWLGALAAVLLLALSLVTWQQLRFWQSSTRLYEHALGVTEDNFVVHTKLAEAQIDQGRRDEAIANFRAALRIDNDFAHAHLNLGVALAEAGEHEESWQHLVEAVRLAPDLSLTHSNLATAYEKRGQVQEAIRHYGEALGIDPANVAAHYNLGQTLLMLGRIDEAIAHFRSAIRFDPTHVMAHNNMGVALVHLGRLQDAVAFFRSAAELDPNDPAVVSNLAATLSSLGDSESAVRTYKQAIALDPNYPQAHNGLGAALAARGEIAEAIPHFQEALRLDPQYAEARDNLQRAEQNPAPPRPQVH